MRKAIAIFLIFSHLMAATQFREVLKLPLLISHYLEHEHEHKPDEPDEHDEHGEGHLSLTGFLHLHYDSDHDDTAGAQHHEKHSNLPFKTDCYSGFACIFLKPDPPCTTLPQYAFYPGKGYPAQLPGIIHSRNAADIWQPPRLG